MFPNLYNVMISYQVTKAFDKDFGNYKTNWTFNNYSANDVDIHIYDINDTGSLSISYDYLVDKYTSNDINSIHTRILYMIQQILENDNIFTNEIEIITKDEKNTLITDFNDTSIGFPKNKTIVDLFEEQVEKSPNNIAISFKVYCEIKSIIVVFLHMLYIILQR